MLDRKKKQNNLDCLEEIVDRSMDLKGNSGEGSEGREESSGESSLSSYRIHISL